jgi:putative FmdB family regulatory protein
MPIYEYACSDCGYQMEARQRFTDPPLRVCPSCENETLDRLISESSFALRGGGWYADGYGPGGKKEAPAATPPATGGEAAAKPDAAAPKPEPKPVESKPAASPKPAAD